MESPLISAVLCRYWNLIEKYYYKATKQMSEYECYDCLIDTVDYMVHNRVWEDPNHKLYGDENAPDKIMNKKMFHNYCTCLQLKNRHNHKSNLPMMNVSFEELLENGWDEDSDVNETRMVTEDYDSGAMDMIAEYYKKYDYSVVFILYCILCKYPFNSEKVEGGIKVSLNISRLSNLIRDMEEDDYNRISTIVRDDVRVVGALAKLYKDLKTKDIKDILNKNLNYLRMNSFFRERLGNVD